MQEKYYKSLDNSDRLAYHDGLELYHIQITNDGFAILQKDINIPYKSITKEEFYKKLRVCDVTSTLNKLFA